MEKKHSPCNGDKEIGGRVRKYREKRHFTQKQLAEAVMISQSSITRLENGENMVSVFTMMGISKTLDVPITDLLFDGELITVEREASLIAKLKKCSPEQREKLIRSFEQIVDACLE